MVVFECPFCDYTNTSRKSVEGHISGKSDEAHKGKVGRAYRGDLEAEAQPEGLRERLFDSGAGRRESLREEIEDVRAAVDQVQESAAAGDDQLESEIERLRSRVSSLEDATEERFEAIERTLGNVTAFLNDQYQSEEIVCPNCQTEVRFGYTPGSRDSKGKCPNCGTEPFSLESEKAEPGGINY